MTARQIIVAGAMPSRDANGRALPARLRFYEAGTALSTPGVIYTSSALTTAHDWPLLSDSAGRFAQIWVDDANTFDVVWTDLANDAQIEAFSDISALSDYMGAAADTAEAAAEAAETAEAGAEQALADAEALLAEHTGEPFQATSETSLLIGTGTKSLTLEETGKLFSVGQTVVIARTSAPSTQMTGVIQTFDSDTGAMTVEAAATGGSGTHTDWTISLSSPGGVQSLGGETGVITAPDGRTALDVLSASEAKAFAIAFAAVL